MNSNIFLKFIFLIYLVISQVTTNGQNLSLAWSKEFSNPQVPVGGSVIGWAVQKNGNGDIYVVGNFSNTADFDPGPGVANLSSVGSMDIFIAKYDANGNYIYARSFGGLGSESPFSLAIDAAGYLYMAGGFNGICDFDPGPGVANRTSADATGDFFVAKYDADGNFVFANAAGGVNYDEGTSLKVDAGGNVYATGYFSGTADFDPGPGVVNLSAAGAYNIFIVKYDINGSYVFAKNIGGPGAELSNGLYLDGSGNIYITGAYDGTVDFDPSPGVANLTTAGGNDIFLAKYDAAGNYVFAKSMGGTANYDEAMDITIDATGNIYLTGHYSGTPDMDPGPGVANLPFNFSDAVFFAKYDSNGNYVFAYGMGGVFAVDGYRILLDGSGNIFLIGYFNQTIDFDPGPGVSNLTAAGSDDAFLAKYDANGNYIFAKGIGGTAADKVWGLFIDGSGNAIITGNFRNTVDFDPGPGTSNLTAGTGAANAYVASYTNNGNYQFAGMLGGYDASSYPDLGYDVALDGSGNVYITGSFTGTVDFDPGPGVANLTSTAVNTADVFIAKYDAAGNYLYAKQMGGISADNAYSLFVDVSGNVYITGTFSGTADFDPGPGVVNLVSAGITDIFFAKYDASGNYVYAKGIGGTNLDYGASLSVDGSGNVYVTGYYQGTVDFNPGAGVANLVSAGSDDIFFAKYDASGNYVYAKSIGGTGTDNGNSIKVDGNGSVYITGYYQGTADFDPGAGVVNLVSAGANDIFAAKYDASGNYVYAKSFGGSGNDAGNKILVDAGGNIYVAGSFSSIADFDPGAGVVNLVSAGSNDIFIAKYNTVGNYVYAKSMGGSNNDNGSGLISDAGGNIYMTGNFTGTADFDPNAGTQTQTAWNNSDIYLVKLTECLTPEISLYSATAVLTSISGATLITDGGCVLLASILPNGINPISGTLNARNWVESSVPTFGGEPFVARHFEITPNTNPSTATAKLTLYFTQQEFDNFNAHPASPLDLPANPTDASGKSNLRIGKYSGTSNNGTGMPGSYAGPATILDPVDADIIWNSTNNKWEVSFDVNGFSGFIVQTNPVALPVTLIEFKGRLLNNNALLNWKTENEQNTNKIIIERSIDGRNYTTIGNLTAYNTTGTHLYNYTDMQVNLLSADVIYYRLKLVDIDGRYSYSGIVALSLSNKTITLLYPNPVQYNLNLLIATERTEKLQLTIIDNTGRAIMQKELSISAGSVSTQWDVDKLATGMYFLRIESESIQQNIRFVKQ